VGWTYGEARPTSITFFLDGTAMVSDQYGRPIRGAMSDGNPVFFAISPPEESLNAAGSYPTRHREIMEGGRLVKKEPLATHAQVIAALVGERIDWLKLSLAGTPQLPYEELKKYPYLSYVEERHLRRIPDPQIRRDILRVKREVDEAREKELQAVEAE
jgi:hypothetical protein